MAISLYIHFPFCGNACGYCDFYKEKYDPEHEEEFCKAVLTELKLAKDSIKKEDRVLETIYIGGGTPSLIDFWHLKHLVSMIKEYFEIDPLAEFSFEINPESIDSEKLLALKELGINRPVFGIQSFNAKLLGILGRKHNLNDSYRAVYLSGACGFKNFGIDMMFGLPHQNSRMLSDDLNQLIDLAPPHISYYQLTLTEDGPLRKKIDRGKLRLPDQDLTAAMYRGIYQELKKHSYIRYEISSFAIPGFECKHNLRYWEGGDFLGLGPSAHSFIGNRRFANTADTKTYTDKLANGERPLVYDTESRDSRITEAIMLGLRTARGIEREAFEHRFGMPIEKAISRESLEMLVKEKLIDPGDDYIKLTDFGFPLADEIIRRLVK